MSRSRISCRIFIIVTLPFIVPWSFFSTLFRDFGRAFYYATLAARTDIEAARVGWVLGWPYFTPED